MAVMGVTGRGRGSECGIRVIDLEAVMVYPCLALQYNDKYANCEDCFNHTSS